MPIQKSKTKKRPNDEAAAAEASIASPAPPAPRSPPKRGKAAIAASGNSPNQAKRPRSSSRRGAFSSGEEDNAAVASIQSPMAPPPSAPAAVAVNVEIVSSPPGPGPKKRGRPRKTEGEQAVQAIISGDEGGMSSPPPGVPKGKKTPAARKKKQEQAEADAAVAAMEAAARADEANRQISAEQVIEEQVVVEEVAHEEIGHVVHIQQDDEDLPVLEPEMGAIHPEDGTVQTVTLPDGTTAQIQTAPGQENQQENILVMLENGEVTAINPADAMAMGLTTADGQPVYATVEGGKIITEQDLEGHEGDPNYPQDPALLCPICSDSNSGYHYGIFACESCKGFFKRAIQNNRQLRCNFTGNCDITIATRKRCAACRLRKCLLAGMKVEAIRLDRRRGGRSVYIGPPPLPHFRPQRYIKSSTGLKPYRSDQLLQAETARLLTDVMNLEPQMAEDGEMEPCCEPLLTEADPDPGAAILHLAEHRLYRLIHWARQLPNFSGIETNDQIVLLQNSWANLLALFMCWQSTGSDNLVMNFNKQISRKLAQMLGLEDIFDRVEQMSEFFNTIGLEREEYVAVRLLILVNPDVEMLSDPLKVREFQEQFSEMLLFHTITYRAIESLRFTTILLKIQEIAHIGHLLHNWMLQRYDSYDDSNRPQLTGLLVELLKHESVVGGQSAMGRMTHLQAGDVGLGVLGDEGLMAGVPDDHHHGPGGGGLVHSGARHHVVHHGGQIVQVVATGNHHHGDVDTSEVVDNLHLADDVVAQEVVGQEEIVESQVVHVVVDAEHGGILAVTENHDH